MSELETELMNISNSSDDILQRSEQAVRTLQNSIKKVKLQLAKNTALESGDEIRFFKEIKPKIVSQLIYHLNVYNIEINRPATSIECAREFLHFELDKLKLHFEQNKEFYRYYRSGKSYMDHLYFIRGKLDISLNLESYVYETDPNFCTSHDFKVSKILACDLLRSFLEKELGKLDSSDNSINASAGTQNLLKWTGSKVALTELIYGLYTSGAVNHGNASMKELAFFFEKSFNVELGQFYRIYTELKMRHDRTRFLDEMKEKLLKKMEDDDEKL